MNNALDPHEPVLAALFAHLQAAATVLFTADATLNDPVLRNVSSAQGLFDGLPVFGPGAGAGITIQDVGTGTITLTQPLSKAGTAVPFKTGFLTASRRERHWSDATLQQPALFLRHLGVTDMADPQSCLMQATLECDLWIYTNAGQNPELSPDTPLNNLARMIRASFAPDSDEGEPRFTLGGLVYWCRIEGRSTYWPGSQGPQAVANIPVRITLP